MPSLTKVVPKNSQLHKKLVELIDPRLKLAARSQTAKARAWTKAEDAVLAYVPESDLDAKRRVAREDRGQPKYTTIKIPYAYALLMTAHTYLTSIFFARSPIHQFAGRHGETEEQVNALEALINYQTNVGEMIGPYYMWIYDSLKYGVGIIQEFWDEQEVQYTTIRETTDDFGEVSKELVRVRTPGYKGNKIINISPFAFFPDPRVTTGNFQEGEFVFVRKRISWETVLRRKAQGFYMNIEDLKVDHAKDFAGTSSTESSQLPRPEDTQQMQMTDGLKHPSTIAIYEGCIVVVPREWGLGNSDFPEKWMFTITGDLSLLIGVQPLGAVHDKFPYGVMESEVEAYGSYNRGIPEITEGIGNTLDWLINQHFFNVRASLNNQFILDPSKIVARDAEDGGPGFVYRLKPEAYGQDLRSFFHQIPVQDVTQGHIGDMSTMLGIGERVTGISDQLMGVLSGGGRKTATEVRTSTGFGVNRLKTIGEFMSVTAVAQHAQRLVQTTQQYYDGEQKFKIVGELVTDMSPEAQQSFLSIKPEDIVGFYDFVPVDGTLPVDRLAMANLWKEIMLQMRTVPGLTQRYDFAKIFAHVAQLGGIRNLNRFKIEVGSPEALAQQADAGNIVPVGGGNLPKGVPSVAQSATTGAG